MRYVCFHKILHFLQPLPYKCTKHIHIMFENQHFALCIRRCSWAVVPPTRRWTARYVDCLTILYFPSVLLYKNTYLYSIRKPTLRFLPYILDDIIGLYYPFKLRRIAWYVDCLIIFYFLYALVNKHTTHIISEN
jgi:hypothetical protein